MPSTSKPRIQARMPSAAMVLAAGKGTRLAQASNGLPKPLVEVAGRPLIDHALDTLVDAGVERAVVNTHHMAEQIERHLAGRTRPEIMISREDRLLNTGGGTAKALPLLGGEPFFVLNADLVWGECGSHALARLAARWEDDAMDALLLLYPTARVFGYDGLGDFLCDPIGRLNARPERHVAPFMYTGAQLVHPRLFEGMEEGAFPFNDLWRKAETDGRLFGIVHDGEWLDAGTPERLAHARSALGDSRQGVLL